ncbi:DUF58 domain-containing protein [Microbacterium indicum]|uniref:DUF58 domain-containing protein n=1 Tax=Microbacterium indicum TaxID=358100 RepID=UPI00041E871F|nr:DUF58 domain-containing protein [Microbacterium indicum]
MTRAAPRRIVWARPTSRGVAMVVVGAVVVGTGIPLGRVELVAIGGALLVTAVLSLLALAVPPLSRVSRALSADLVSVGDVLRVRTTVVGGSAAMTDDADDLIDDAFDPVEVSPAAVGRGGVRLDYAVVATRRGRHGVGPLQITDLSPFGTWVRRYPAGAIDAVVAVPQIIELRPLAEAGSAYGDRPSPSPRLGQGSDNLIPRPYAPGDAMRRVHWRASAHHGDLMVREEEQEHTPGALVILTRSPVLEPQEFEACVTACASVVARLSRDGYVVTVCDDAGDPLGSVDGGAGLADLLETLATVEQQDPGADRAPADAGFVVAIGTAPFVPAGSAPHLLLAPAPAEAPGWRVGAISDGIDVAWIRATGGAR